MVLGVPERRKRVQVSPRPAPGICPQIPAQGDDGGGEGEPKDGRGDSGGGARQDRGGRSRHAGDVRGVEARSGREGGPVQGGRQAAPHR